MSSFAKKRRISRDRKNSKSKASKKNSGIKKTSLLPEKQATSPLPERQVPQQKSTCYNDIMSEVKKSNDLLLTLVNRLKKTEARLRVVESSIKNSSSSSSSTSGSSSRTKDVPAEVRVSVVRVYS